MAIDVLFVCLGNICRSPMAEAVFQKLVDDADLSRSIGVDSAGIGGWHIGRRAHPGTRKVLKRHKIPYEGRARQVQPADMSAKGRYIIVMDESNMDDLVRRYGRRPKMHRLLEFASETDMLDISDPYYSGRFEEVFNLVAAGCRGLLAAIRKNEGLDSRA